MLTSYLVAVTSTVPFFAVWYLTSPMVMWIHIPVPRDLHQLAPNAAKKVFAQRLLQNDVSPDTEIFITTMNVVCKPRVSRMQIKDLRQEKRRMGLVDHVRDVRELEAQRKWYQFPTVGEFKIEKQREDLQKKLQWLWYPIYRKAIEVHGSGKNLDVRKFHL